MLVFGGTLGIGSATEPPNPWVVGSCTVLMPLTGCGTGDEVLCENAGGAGGSVAGDPVLMTGGLVEPPWHATSATTAPSNKNGTEARRLTR